MSAELKIQRLSVVDAAAFVALRRMALETEPLALGASADDDVGQRVHAGIGERTTAITEVNSRSAGLSSPRYGFSASQYR